MRKTGKPTRYPGVLRLTEGRYRIRAKVQDPRTGRIREIDREVEARSPSDAAMERDRLRAEASNPIAEVERPRLGPFAESWLESRGAELKASTAERYGEALDLHIAPVFKHWYLDAITENDIAKWRDGMTGAPATRNGRLRVLRTLLEAAVPRYIAFNPAARVGSVREVRVDDEPNRLTAAEVRKVLDELRKEHDEERATLDLALSERPGLRHRLPMAYPIALTLVSTGGRWGEVSALRWSDIDEQADVIHIRRAHWNGIVDTTKTGRTRTVPLTPELATALLDHRKLLVAAQHPGLDDGLVFPSTKGELRVVSSIRKPLRRALAAAGVTRRQTVHGLRRTFNDLVRQVASGEVVRAMTGHVTERMTEHYSHVAATEKAAAVARVFRVIAGGDATPERKESKATG